MSFTTVPPTVFSISVFRALAIFFRAWPFVLSFASSLYAGSFSSL
jgi:hypothetical protein